MTANIPFDDRIDRWVEEKREHILQLNRSLVSVPSENRVPYGDEARVQEVVYGHLERLGCEMDRFTPDEVPGIKEHPAYLAGRHYENRFNVVGRKKGAGGGRSLMFSGHMDTVPRGDEPWSVDPFAGEVRGGKQYGLGIFDMKGGMVAAIAALQALDELGIRLAGDVIVETVVDEEYGGANGTLAARLRGYEADIAIIPEPSNLTICPETQGGGMYRITFHGKPGRSFSGEEPVNPVFAAARFLLLFREYQAAHASKKPASAWFSDDPGLTSYIQGVRAGAVHVPLQDRTPGTCSIDVWIQCYPETGENDLFDEFVGFMKKRSETDELLSNTDVRYEKLIRFLPGSGIPDGHDILPLTAAIGKRYYEQGLPVRGAAFACDSFMFNLHSETPAIVWGPKGGNAHAPDEFIDIDDFMNLVKMFAQTMVAWCGAEKS